MTLGALQVAAFLHLSLLFRFVPIFLLNLTLPPIVSPSTLSRHPCDLSPLIGSSNLCVREMSDAYRPNYAYPQQLKQLLRRPYIPAPIGKLPRSDSGIWTFPTSSSVIGCFCLLRRISAPILSLHAVVLVKKIMCLGLSLPQRAEGDWTWVGNSCYLLLERLIKRFLRVSTSSNDAVCDWAVTIQRCNSFSL